MAKYKTRKAKKLTKKQAGAGLCERIKVKGKIKTVCGPKVKRARKLKLVKPKEKETIKLGIPKKKRKMTYPKF